MPEHSQHTTTQTRQHTVYFLSFLSEYMMSFLIQALFVIGGGKKVATEGRPSSIHTAHAHAHAHARIHNFHRWKKVPAVTTSPCSWVCRNGSSSSSSLPSCSCVKLRVLRDAKTREGRGGRMVTQALWLHITGVCGVVWAHHVACCAHRKAPRLAEDGVRGDGERSVRNEDKNGGEGRTRARTCRGTRQRDWRENWSKMMARGGQIRCHIDTHTHTNRPPHNRQEPKP
jgi:hypothetical protein